MYIFYPNPEVKTKLRAKKLSTRKQQSPQLKKLNDHKIVQKISRLQLFKKAQKILLYVPIHGEVDVTELITKFPKKTFVLPRVTGKSLKLHIIESLEQTAKGTFNIHEPHKHLPAVKPEELDLIFVPGVVFSLDGHRIGYGKGFYDRLLKKTIGTKIGIAYDFQIVKNIPGQPHDVSMDMIITTKKTLKVRREKSASASRV